ncbi:MAG: ATP synthase F1 subunit delta [Bacteroidia bacterium]|nr:ATP synthase F1 subunit delta [Bacteroidia bacterium]
MATADNRYAKSLMDLTIEAGQLDAVRKDLKLMLSTIEQNHELALLLESPIVKKDKKISVLTAIFEKKISKVSMSFLTLITNKNREAQLVAILKAFEEQYKTHNNIFTAVVTSAKGLDQKTKDKVLELVKSQMKGEVELIEKIDAGTIGGFVLRIGDKQIDRSVASDLHNLKKKLTNKALN